MLQTVENSWDEEMYPAEPRPWMLLVMLGDEIYPTLPSPATVDGNHPLIPITLLTSCVLLTYPTRPRPWMLLVMLSVETYPALPSPVTVDGNHSSIPFTLLKSCAELI